MVDVSHKAPLAGHFRTLTSLRFFAAMAVLLLHFFHLGPDAHEAAEVGRPRWGGGGLQGFARRFEEVRQTVCRGSPDGLQRFARRFAEVRQMV